MVITRNRWPLDRSQVATTNWPSVAQVVLAAPGRVVWPIVNVVDADFQLPAAPTSLTAQQIGDQACD